MLGHQMKQAAEPLTGSDFPKARSTKAINPTDISENPPKT